MLVRSFAWLPLLLALPSPALAFSGEDATWVWRGVDEADGPPYGHLDLASLGGTDLALGTGGAATVSLPFAFPFYGTDWTEITVHAYGVVSMGTGGSDPGPYASAAGCIADGTSLLSFVAPLWEDWDLDTYGAVYVATWPEAVFVQWDDVRQGSAETSAQDFGVWLYATGEVAFVWDDLWSGSAATSYGLAGAAGLQSGAQGVSLGCSTGGIAAADQGTTFTPWGVGHLSGTMPADTWADAMLDGDGASDRFGAAVDVTWDLDGDWVRDLAVGAPYDDDGGSNAGTAWLFSGADLAGNLGPADAVAGVIGAVAGDQLGTALHGGGDLDGDAIADLAIGAPGDDTGGREAGAVMLFSGADLSGLLDAADAYAAFTGTAAGDAAGTRLVFTYDLTADGHDDLAVAAPYADGGATDGGAVYIIFGSTSLSGGALSSADAILQGPTAGECAGYRLADPGDVDGDGLGDLLVGAWGADGSGTDAGAAYVVLGADLTTGTASLRSHNQIDGIGAGDMAGLGVAGAGDPDGDGLDGIFVGAYGAGTANEGAACYLAGRTATWPHTLAGADATLMGDASDRLGHALAALDFGDGAGGLAAGAYGDSDGAASGGAVHLFHGDGLVDGSSATTADARGVLLGTDAAGYLGAALDAGDLDGDGYDDIAAGAWGATGGASASGRVIVLRSRPGYPDADGDGFMPTWRGGPDCDDDDPSVGPGATETCDGVDEDCDGVIDEDFGDSDADGTADCIDVEECDGLDNDGDSLVDEDQPDTDGDGTCDGLDAEDCDGLDNDGDGLVDEDFGDSDADGIADCLDVEECDGLDNDGDGVADEGYPDADFDGIADCADWESCDGLDNDGDGLVDEGFDDGDHDGIPDCIDDETCDGVDNDGDDEIDEDMPDTDGDGLCDGMDSEECDGLDNDGDGRVDEGFPDTDADGTPDCLDAEECDGLDNDGDGEVDEGFPDTDADGIADCEDDEECDGLDNDGDGLVDEGAPDTDRDGTPDCLDAEECDGLDNDGDGDIDEGFTDTDGDGVADCADAEECDGLDNDGDGLTDEDFTDDDGDGVADCIDLGPQDTGSGGKDDGCGGCASGRGGAGLWLGLMGLGLLGRRREG
ncbi:MAG: MopE-related protein [Pseudomonadota bacterium]